MNPLQAVVDIIRFIAEREWDSRAEEVRLAQIVLGLQEVLVRVAGHNPPVDIQAIYHRSWLLVHKAHQDLERLEGGPEGFFDNEGDEDEDD